MRRAAPYLLCLVALAFNYSCAYGQGCGLSMTPEYEAYASVSVSGTTIYTSATIQGYAVIQPSAGCSLNGVTHQGQAYNMLSTTGGWVYGPSQCPSCFISVSNNQSIVASPGVTYPFTWDGLVHCSKAGTFFSRGGSSRVDAPTISGPDTVWYFNGQSPSAYPTSVTLTSSAGAGTWSVTSGSTRINLSTTSGATTTVTPSGSHFSATQDDTCVTVTVSGIASSPFCLTVRTPWRLVSNPTVSNTSSDSQYGYATVIGYDLHDNLDVLVPQDILWNEVVGTAQNLNGSNWATCCGAINASGGSTGPLLDLLQPPLINYSPTPPSPTPTYNNPPSGATMFRQASQSI